jgi:hypothetical protein
LGSRFAPKVLIHCAAAGLVTGRRVTVSGVTFTRTAPLHVLTDADKTIILQVGILVLKENCR